MPVTIPRDIVDNIDWWKDHQPSDELPFWIGEVANEAASWSSSLRIWGNENDAGDCLFVFYENNARKNVEWIEIRADARDLNIPFLTAVISLGLRLNSCILGPDYRLLQADLSRLLDALRSSVAHKLVEDPAATLKALKPSPSSESKTILELSAQGGGIVALGAKMALQRWENEGKGIDFN